MSALPSEKIGDAVDRIPTIPTPTDYFARAFPEPYRILGLKLLPLSLGRYKRLKRFGCAYVAEGEARAGIDDLLLGLLVCSMRCREFDEFIEGVDSPARRGRAQELKKWGRKIRAEVRADGAFNLCAKVGLFRHYLQSSAEVPKYFEEDLGASRQSGAHWSHSVEVTLRSELGWSEEEIEERPLGKALADYFRWAEGQGLVRLMSAEEEEAIARGDDAFGEASVSIDAGVYLKWLKEQGAAVPGVMTADQVMEFIAEREKKNGDAADRVPTGEEVQNGS